MQLTVLSVAYPLAPVAPDTAGGAEQVLAQLDCALVQAGHRSLVIACEGSRVAGTLISIPAASGVLDDAAKANAQIAACAAIEETLSTTRVDVVHLHGIDFHTYLPQADVPVLVTLHLPPEWYAPEVFRLDRKNTWLHCVSHSQHQRCPANASLLQPIPNGISLITCRPGRRKHRYAVALGRICPEKGFEEALAAADLAGLPLIVAGQLYRYPEHEAYFRERVEPNLNGNTGHRYIGPIGPERKRRLLAGARCLLNASTAPETSSLVAMEALACGTPVIAYPSGALPEIVRHGETGYLVNTAAEMAEAIGRVNSISPQTCREYAETHLDARQTVARYFEAYRTVRGHSLASAGTALRQT